jgi:lysozyme
MSRLTKDGRSVYYSFFLLVYATVLLLAISLLLMTGWRNACGTGTTNGLSSPRKTSLRLHMQTIVANPNNADLTPSIKAIDLIKDYEGLRLVAYDDPRGIKTIGFGHVLKNAEPWVITRAQAYNYLLQDVSSAGSDVKRWTKVELNQNQFDALVSFDYNVGVTNFSTSTLLFLLNEGKYQQAVEQFPCWVHAGNAVEYGLVRRRLEEASLFSSPMPKIEVAAAYPPEHTGE